MPDSNCQLAKSFIVKVLKKKKERKKERKENQGMGNIQIDGEAKLFLKWKIKTFKLKNCMAC